MNVKFVYGNSIKVPEIVIYEAVTPLFGRWIRSLFRAYSVRKGMVRGMKHTQYTVRRPHFEFFAQNNGFKAVI